MTNKEKDMENHPMYESLKCEIRETKEAIKNLSRETKEIYPMMEGELKMKLESLNKEKVAFDEGVGYAIDLGIITCPPIDKPTMRITCRCCRSLKNGKCEYKREAEK
jgi:hypothetical protein